MRMGLLLVPAIVVGCSPSPERQDVFPLSRFQTEIQEHSSIEEVHARFGGPREIRIGNFTDRHIYDLPDGTELHLLVQRGRVSSAGVFRNGNHVRWISLRHAKEHYGQQSPTGDVPKAAPEE